jgi:hypothetical protein
MVPAAATEISGSSKLAMFMRRLVLVAVTFILNLGGLVVAIGAGWWYYQDNAGWSVGLVAILVGLGSALVAWFLAALISLLVEIADSLREIVQLGRSD